MEPLTEIGGVEGGADFGENVTDIVDGLTCHSILHSTWRIRKLSTCFPIFFAARDGL